MLFGSALACDTASLRADAVDDYILRVMEDQHIPGLALAVVRNGETVKGHLKYTTQSTIYVLSRMIILRSTRMSLVQ